METANPIQAALVSTDLIESSLPDGKVRPRWLIREPRGCAVGYITGGSGKGYTQKRQMVRTRRYREFEPVGRSIIRLAGSLPFRGRGPLRCRAKS